MLTPSNIRKTMRSQWTRYNAYRRAYSNIPEWPLVLRLRKPLFKSTAVLSCQYLAKGTVLDIGTGSGTLPHLLEEIAPNIRVIGVDLERALLQDAQEHALQNGARSRASFIVADAHALPFSDGSSDMVVSIASLHLWHGRDKCVGESYRVLKQGGLS